MTITEQEISKNADEFKESGTHTEYLYDKPKSVTEQLQEDHYVDDWDE